MKRKRSHKNTTRLTARERALGVVAAWSTRTSFSAELWTFIERALQAHARQALARERLRQKGRRP